MHWLTSVTINSLLTDGVFQGHSLYFAVLNVVHVGNIPLSVVFGLGALMKTPDYKQEVQVQPWGDKNSTRTK
jgi:hypothetical protein